MTDKFYVTIAGETRQVTPVDNAATRALMERLGNGDIEVTLNSSGGFEIWGPLGFSLPTANEQVNAQPGDIVLYNGSNICMFYGTNSWSYTRLGHFDDMTAEELATFLKAGQSNISVVLSRSAVVTGVDRVGSDVPHDDVYYDLAGRRVARPTNGIYIKNGKKTVR